MSCPCPYTKTRVVTLSTGRNVFGDGDPIEVPNNSVTYTTSDPEYIQVRGTKLYIVTASGGTCTIYHNNGTSQALADGESVTIYGVIDAVVIVAASGGNVVLAECYQERPRAEKNLATLP